MNRKELSTLLIAIVLTATLPVGVFLALHQQELRKRAFVEAGPAMLSLFPNGESVTYQREESISVDIILGSGGEDVRCVQITLNFDSDRFTAEPVDIREVDWVEWSGYIPTNVSIPISKVADSVVRFDMCRLGDPGITDDTIPDGKVGTVVLTVKDDAPEGDGVVEFAITGDFPSKVISDDIADILGTVYGGAYEIVVAECSTGETQSCIADNGCDGEQPCEDGSWGDCVTDLVFCDTDCDGVDDTCVGDCQECVCVVGEIQSCEAENTCDGEQTCESGGVWGECLTEKNHCDEDCDGVPEICLDVACTICTCTTGQIRSCVTGDNFVGVQTCTAEVWGDCVKDEPHTCRDDEPYELCEDDVCLLDCGECAPLAEEDCNTADHFKGTKTCLSDRTWGGCVAGTECEDGYSLCPDGTCQTECPAATLSFDFKLENVYASDAPSSHVTSVRVFAREAGTDIRYDQAFWKKEIAVDIDSNGNGSVSGLSLEGFDPGGSYEFLLKGCRHLQKMETVSSLGDTVTLGFGTLLAGDVIDAEDLGNVWGDNWIKSYDMSFWISEWSLSVDVESRADFNGDKRVNSIDYNYIYSNFRAEGNE